ncbi:hypothetical protein [Methanoculleus sp.]|uniref:hypothetical protein n=1 Tax=Methanoculleus sp. TaxID=90427 RepID=UPI002FCA53C5
MEFDRKFLLLSLGEVLVVAAANLAVALILQVIVLAAYLGDRRGYPVFGAGAILFAAVLSISGTVALLVLAAALVCGYAALTAYDYRLARRAAGES